MNTSPDLHTVEAYPITAIKEKAVPWEIPECPLSSEARRLLLAECPIIVDMTAVDPRLADDHAAFSFTPPREVSGYDPEAVSLRQPSGAHNRSFELQGEAFTEPWNDEHGNYYRAFTLKGNNFSNPGVMEHPTAIDQYVAWGLQESKIIERVLRVSEVLRERGVSTEYIVGLAEPQAYPFAQLDRNVAAYEMLPLAEYRRRIVQNYWQKLPEEQQTFDGLVDIQSKFNDMTFYISMRATDTAYRLGDIMKGSVARRREVFDEINSKWLRQGDEPLSSTSMGDINRYVQRYLAPSLAKNLARMHVDLAHGFLHDFNITALGGIVDVDSVHGESLGFDDEPITDIDRAQDVLQAARGLYEATYMGIGNIEQENTVWEFSTNYITETDLLLGSFDLARQRIGNIVTAIDELALEAGNTNEYLAISGVLKSVYLGAYFTGSEEFKSHDAAFKQLLTDFQPDLEHFEDIITDELLLNTKDAFLNDYINDIQEGSVDIDRHLFDPRNPVTKMVQREVLDKLKSMAYPLWGEQAQLQIPGLLVDLTPDNLETVFHAHCDEHHLRFKQLAEAIAPKLISANWDKVIASLQVERAEPVLEGSTFYYNGRKDGFLWAMTEGISVTDAMRYADDNNIAMTSHDITSSKSLNVGFVEINRGDEVYEVITNIPVETTQYTDEHLRIDVTPRSTKGEPLYALVIKRDDEGNKHHELHMIPEDRIRVEAILDQDWLF